MFRAACQFVRCLNACRRGALRIASLGEQEFTSVLDLLDNCGAVPMSLADGCLVRFTEILPAPLTVMGLVMPPE